MNDHVKPGPGQPGQSNKNWSKYVMLRQEMESYPIMIGASAHNKDDNKQGEDTW